MVDSNSTFDKNISDKEKWELIKKKVWSIENIENPTEEMCLYCVENAWNTLKSIKNPTDKIIMTALNSNGWAIQFVNNPTEEQKRVAVNNTFDAIKYIQNPSIEVQLAAVKNNYRAIKFINNPSFAVKVAAIEQNPSAIASFDYSEDEFYELLKHSLAILKYTSSYDNDKVMTILRDEIGKEDISSQYINEYIHIEALKIDKTDFIYKFGSNNAKKYYVDYKLDM